MYDPYDYFRKPTVLLPPTDLGFRFRIFKWNRHPDIALLTFLGVDEKFWSLESGGDRSRTEAPSSSSAADALTDHTRRWIEQQTTLIRKTTTMTTTSRTVSSMRVSFLVSLSTQN